MRTARRSFIGVLLTALTWASPASAAGYDTPVLYTARHMGMGGTAIASVRDGSAPFHNPAGMAHMGAGNLILDVSLLTGHLVANPAPVGSDAYANETRSNTTIAPFFLVGGGARVADWLTVGLALYPVASAGGVYEYHIVEPTIDKSGDQPIMPAFSETRAVYDETKIVFFELAPTLAVNLPGNLRLGFSYRLSMIQMDRFQGTSDDHGANLSFELSGFNFAGYKAGLQWTPIEELEVGFVYRSETQSVIESNSDRDADGALVNPNRLFGLHEYDRSQTTFTLPDKFGLGIRGTVKPVSLALDMEYTFNSKVQTQTFQYFKDPPEDAEPTTGPVEPDFELVNFARWQDNLTVRLGLEYCITLEPVGLEGHHLKPRLGYVYDGQVGNKSFPTAFGTPPTATQTWTAGLGYKTESWEISVAYAYRYGSVTIDKTDIPHESQPNTDSCLACSKPGFYELALHGIYADVSWDF